VRVDFADVKKVMLNSGRAHMSMVKATGENRALEVAEGALSSSLLDDNNINGAKEILINFAVNNIDNITQDDITIAMECIQKHASYKDEDGNIHAADIIWGACQKPSLGEDELEMVIVATRFTDDEVKIDPTYTDHVDPFPGPDVIVKPIDEPKKPGSDIAPRENVIITPQQDKYRQVGLQKREPAYVRLRSQFEVESDSQQKVSYQQSVAREERHDEQSNGMLQF
jgi:cell division protein FtsZ